MNDLIERLRLGDGTSPDHELLLEAADALEALAQPEQEPVAWEQFYPDIGKPQIAFNAEVIGYVAPQRTWVGLSDAEIIEAWHWGGTDPHIEGDHFTVLYKYFEAKLKDKNHV